MKSMKWAAAALLWLSVGICAAAEDEGPDTVWLRAEAALQTGDMAEMRKHMTKAGLEALDKMDRKTVDTQFAMIRDFTPKSPRVVDKQVSADGRTATLKAMGTAKSVVTGQPETYYGTIVMVKEGDAWKVGEQTWSPKP